MSWTNGKQTARPQAVSDGPKLTFREMMIDPDVAAKMLERNTSNRPWGEKTVVAYANVMRRGDWMHNGVPIVFDINGTLVDGQHRLMAVQLAEVAVKMLVVEGVDPEAFGTFDAGKKRNNSDALGIMGEVNTPCLAGALGLLFRYQIKVRLDHGQYSPTAKQLKDWLTMHAEIRDSVAEATKHKSRLKGIMGPSQVAFLHYIGWKAPVIGSRHKADEFVRGLADGVGLDPETGLYLLRERLNRLRGNRKELTRLMVFALAIKAMRAHLLDKPMRSLRWNSTTEEFPRLESNEA